MFVVVKHSNRVAQYIATAGDRATAINAAQGELEKLLLSRFPDAKVESKNFSPEITYKNRDSLDAINYMYDGEYLLEHPIEIHEVPHIGQGLRATNERALEIILLNAMSARSENDGNKDWDFIKHFGVDYKRPSTTEMVNVRLLVNDQDVDYGGALIEGMERMMKSHAASVQTAAMNIIKEKSESIIELLQGLDQYHEGLEKLMSHVDREAQERYGNQYA